MWLSSIQTMSSSVNDRTGQFLTGKQETQWLAKIRTTLEEKTAQSTWHRLSLHIVYTSIILFNPGADSFHSNRELNSSYISTLIATFIATFIAVGSAELTLLYFYSSSLSYWQMKCKEHLTCVCVDLFWQLYSLE